jgi:hypothetical protein
MSLYGPYAITTRLLYWHKLYVSLKVATGLHQVLRITVIGTVPAVPWRAQGQIIPILK